MLSSKNLTLTILPLTMLASAQQKKPNFVFFITDDISPNDLGIYGNKQIKTPNLDKLAKKSIVFENAYLTASSCSPSRCSIITSRYPHNTGAPELGMSLPKDQLTVTQVLKNNGYYTVLSGKNHIRNSKSMGFDVCSDSKPAGAEKWVGHLKDRPKDKPFFFWFASHDAHHPFQFNKLAPHYKPSEVPVPPMLYDGPETRKELAAYYHEVSRSDYYVGEVIKELENQGIFDNTYFVFCSDNGRPFLRCKTYLYESGIQTPLLISGPKVKPGRSKSLISSIDFAATFLDLAGIKRPEFFQGRSFQNVLKNPEEAHRKTLFAERNWHIYQSHERMVRIGDYMYIWNAWPHKHNVAGESACYAFPTVKEYWEAGKQGKLTPKQLEFTQLPKKAELLFNVERDPLQMNNLSDSVEYQDMLKKFRKVLNKWQVDTGDTVPTNPTPNRQPLHKRVKKLPKRREFAGQKTNAKAINNPGQF